MRCASLSGRVVLVTGASAGIGLASAARLAEAGASVCMTARRPGVLAAAVEKLAATGADVVGVPGSVADAGERVAVVDACLSRFGRLDVLVNNAAHTGVVGPLLDVDADYMDELVEVNMKAPLHLAQLAYGRWMGENSGVIVNVTSLGARRPRPGFGWYGITKAALDMLTRCLAVELGPAVRVNAVAPGMVLTETLREMTTEEGRRLASMRPAGRIGEPDDIADAVLYLAGPASSFVTGQTLTVDGGGSVV